MGLIPTFSGKATKQRLLLGYTGEIPSVKAAFKISAPSLKLVLTQRRENDQIIKEQKRTIRSKRLESLIRVRTILERSQLKFPFINIHLILHSHQKVKLS